MRISAGLTVSLAKDASSSHPLVRNAIDENGQIAREHRTHWTMPKGSAVDRERFSIRLPSKSVLLTNQKAIEEATQLNENSEDSVSDKNSADLGILSPSRRLRPMENEPENESENDIVASLPQRPSSDFFDSFTTFDHDRTAFYSICDQTVEDEYFCSRCDTNSTEGTVADFECQKVSCYEIDSRCPTNKMVVCRYDTLTRLFENEPVGNASMPYESEKCRRIETRLSKTNRELLPDEESSWDFTYCLRYSVVSLNVEGRKDKNNTCEMEVDGVVCDSCLLQTVDFSPTNSTTTEQKEFCVTFDCGNTILGYSGRFCNSAGLATRSLDYFVYRSLPCDGGCNLCGETNDPAQMMMMRFREADFELPGITNNTQYLNIVGLSETMNCFESQWDALTTTGLVCSDLQLAVKSPCGCTPMGIPTPVPPNTTTNSENSTATEETVEDSGTLHAAGKAGLPTIAASLAVAWLIGFCSL